MRAYREILCVAFLMGLSAGCGKAPPASPAPARVKIVQRQESARKSKGTLAISVLTLTNPFFIQMVDGFKEEAAKHGYEALVVSGEFDVARQQNQVKDFIVKKVSAIALCPCDSKSIGTAVVEAQQAGIPVFTVDIACLAPGVKVVSHIATDNLAGGKLAAKAMIDALGEAGGKVVVLDYKEVESCILRVKGFKEVIEAYNKGKTKGKIEIVAELPGKGQKDVGKKAAEDALQAHPDIAGIFAINDPSALGARAALENSGKADQVKIVGYDGQEEARQAIKEGKIYADPVQYPVKLGSMAVQAMVKHFEGEAVPANLLVMPGLYGKADADKDPSLK